MAKAKTRLQKLEDQRLKREARAEAVPETKAPRATSSTTSYLLANRLLKDLQRTKLALQDATDDRGTYSASTIVRAALEDFVLREMDDQIAMVTRHIQAEARVSE